MLSRRRGFFRMALRTGAYLIPSIGFGETSMYDQVANPMGSALRKLQDWFTHIFTLAPPLFYSTRVIPYRKPLTVVGKIVGSLKRYPFGRPIMCKRVSCPTEEEIDNLREEYKQELREMFNRYRPLYDPTADDIRFF
ncbi:2-acylglycerol O-acyltransferase 1 [Taenia solium]|eukprot:TsM_000046800 transcript=TsM_000046800 gene=TsM_000046800